MGHDLHWRHGGTFTVAGLINGANHSLAMRTVSAGLDDETLTSDQSESVSFVPAGLPLPPTNLSATGTALPS